MLRKNIIISFIGLVLFSCQTTTTNKTSSFDDIMKNQPKVGNWGGFSNHGFQKSICAVPDKHVYLQLGDKILKIPVNRFDSAFVIGSGNGPMTEEVNKLLNSPNIDSLGCKENPFVTDSISLTHGYDYPAKTFPSNSFSISLLNEVTKREYQWNKENFNNAFSSSNCQENSSLKACELTHLNTSMASEDGDYVYVQPLNNKFKLKTNDDYFVRCRNSFSAPACIINDILPTGVVFKYYYFDKTLNGHIAAADQYLSAVEDAITFTTQN